MEFKTLTLQDLKRDYSSRHGFIFQGTGPCDRSRCDLVASLVQSKGYTSSMPEFVVGMNDRTFAFVYPTTASFESGRFYSDTRQAAMMTGAFNIEILSAFLNEH